MFQIAESIKKIRRVRGLSQNELAIRSGLTASYLCLIENGKRSPSVQTITVLSEALDTPVEVLLWDAVEIPGNLSKEDRQICESAKLIVRKFYEATDAPSSAKT